MELGYIKEMDDVIASCVETQRQQQLNAALFRAAEIGSFRACAKLVKHGADVNMSEIWVNSVSDKASKTSKRERMKNENWQMTLIISSLHPLD